MSKSVREMSWEELEEQRQRDIESGAMAYGMTPAAREQQRRTGDPAQSVNTVSSDDEDESGISREMRDTYERLEDDFNITTKFKDTCDVCGERKLIVEGKKAYQRGEETFYMCDDCAFELSF